MLMITIDMVAHQRWALIPYQQFKINDQDKIPSDGLPDIKKKRRESIMKIQNSYLTLLSREKSCFFYIVSKWS